MRLARAITEHGGRSATRGLALALASSAALSIAGCGKGARTTNGSSAAPAAASTASGSRARSRSALPAASVTANTTRLAGEGAIQDAAAVAETVYPGLTRGTRPDAVVLVEAADWPAALAASPLAGAPLHAPILYGARHGVPAATAAALATVRPRGAAALGGAQVIAVGEVEAPSGYRIDRVRSGDPYRLAAKLAALLAHLDGGKIGEVLVASAGGDRALAMPAAALAAESGAPLLLVQPGSVPAATASELSVLHDPSIYAVGPPASVGPGALSALRRIAEARRIGGGDPVQNAIEVAAYTNGSFGWGVQEPGHGLVFARSSQPLAAPAAALLSASADYGPLLLLPSSGPVPRALRAYLLDIQPGYTSAPESLPVRGVYNRGWLIGDAAAISLTAQAELDALLRSVPRHGETAAPAVSP
ncbi:MAG: cell wall-binding repeat-containing protein [Solirubrobacteraceae bacterium]